MKRCFNLLFLAVAVCVLVGACEPGGNRISTESEVSASFPEVLAGTWKAEASRWWIKFAPDGRVVSAMGTNGLLLLIEQGYAYHETVIEGEYAYMEFGPGYATYDADTRQMRVLIDIDYLQMSSAAGSFEADIQYHFEGPLFPEEKKWRAVWWTAGGIAGVGRFDVNEVAREVLMFNKLD